MRKGAQLGGERVEADGAAGIFLDDGEQQVAVDVVQAVLVDAEHGQGVAGDGQIDETFSADFSKIADAAEQAIGDPRGAAAAPGDFRAAGFLPFYAQNFSPAI